MDAQAIYIKMKPHIDAELNQTIPIGQTAHLIGNEPLCKKIAELPAHIVKKEDNNVIIIDLMRIIAIIGKHFPNLDIESIGPSQTIVRVKEQKKRHSIPLFIFVWLLLFFGSGLAIMNFHEDVSMLAVQQKMYEMITGKENDFPLLLQVPYSIGLGIGMILFFNHLFKKKFNEEPSPLEIEMFKYEQDLNQYLILTEGQKDNEKN